MLFHVVLERVRFGFGVHRGDRGGAADACDECSAIDFHRRLPVVDVACEGVTSRTRDTHPVPWMYALGSAGPRTFGSQLPAVSCQLRDSVFNETES